MWLLTALMFTKSTIFRVGVFDRTSTRENRQKNGAEIDKNDLKKSKKV